LNLIDAFRWSKTMFTATSLGIFDLLAGNGPTTAVDMAKKLDTNEDATQRLLDGCVALELLQKTEDLYSNTPAADVYLLRDSPDTLTGYILYSNAALYPMWGKLEDAVREGTHRWTQVFGPERELFANYFKTDESTRTFLQGMHGLGQLGSPVVARTHDLSRFASMVDLGGATGHLAVALRRRYPEMRCAVFDLPKVIAVAREFIAREGVEVGLIEGDFFRDELPATDLFAVGRIFHDWGDEKVLYLLRRMHEKLPPGGGVLIVEKILNEDKSGPLSTLMQSLNMLVVTEGRERTVSEFTALLAEAGFPHVEAKRTGAPIDAILATKA